MKPSKRLIFFLLFAILGISFSFYAFQMVYTPNFQVGKENRLLLVAENAKFKDVQAQLHDGNYVQDLVSFSFLAKLMGYDDQIKPGRYVIKTDMTNMEVLKILRSGKQEPVRITFNNVRLVPELAEKITKNLNMTPPEFESALSSFAASNKYGLSKENIW